jgi:hypothetical protein
MGADRRHVSAPYVALVALAEREWSLVVAGAWEQLPDLVAERDALVAGLGPVAPPEAAPYLQRLVELQTLTSAALTAGRAAGAEELARLRSGRGAVRGYAATAVPAASAR